MQHVLQLYQQEARLLDALADFAGGGLRADEGVVVIASTPRWELLLERLQKSGMDAHGRVVRGQLRLFGLHVILGAVPNRQRFSEVMNGVLALAHGFVPEERETVVIAQVDAIASEPVLPEGVALREVKGRSVI